MVVIDDDFVRHRLLGVGSILAAFPFLNSYRSRLQKLDKECVTCTGGHVARQQRLDLLNEVRTAIAQLGTTDLVKLKGLLQVPSSEEILVAYRSKVGGKSRTDSRIF